MIPHLPAARYAASSMPIPPFQPPGRRAARPVSFRRGHAVSEQPRGPRMREAASCAGLRRSAMRQVWRAAEVWRPSSPCSVDGSNGAAMRRLLRVPFGLLAKTLAQPTRRDCEGGGHTRCNREWQFVNERVYEGAEAGAARIRVIVRSRPYPVPGSGGKRAIYDDSAWRRTHKAATGTRATSRRRAGGQEDAGLSRLGGVARQPSGRPAQSMTGLMPCPRSASGSPCPASAPSPAPTCSDASHGWRSGRRGC